MNNYDLKARTRDFALAVLQLLKNEPRSLSSDILFKQLIRSATSVAANYRAATRAKSPADFTYKLTVVLEEADESLFWLDLIEKGGFVNEVKVSGIRNEANQLTAIFVTAIKTSKGKKQ